MWRRPTLMGLAALVRIADGRAEMWWGQSDRHMEEYERTRDPRLLDRMVRADAIAQRHAVRAAEYTSELMARCGLGEGG